jgi:hypothetical protein
MGRAGFWRRWRYFSCWRTARCVVGEIKDRPIVDEQEFLTARCSDFERGAEKICADKSARYDVLRESSGSDGMPREYHWVRVLTPQRKAELTASFERLIAETLKPKYLPEIRPGTKRNHPIDISAAGAAKTTASSPVSAQASTTTPARSSTRPSPAVDGRFAVMWYGTPAAGGACAPTCRWSRRSQWSRTTRPCARRYVAALAANAAAAA